MIKRRKKRAAKRTGGIDRILETPWLAVLLHRMVNTEERRATAMERVGVGLEAIGRALEVLARDAVAPPKSDRDDDAIDEADYEVVGPTNFAPEPESPLNHDRNTAA